ncbi:hypothetical protein NQ357_25300, partial [Escherichia coli]|nr:hypothetical protein [Escherichia coli]
DEPDAIHDNGPGIKHVDVCAEGLQPHLRVGILYRAPSVVLMVARDVDPRSRLIAVEIMAKGVDDVSKVGEITRAY